MKCSSKAPVTGGRKSSNPCLGKCGKAPVSNTIKKKTKSPTLKEVVSALLIQRIWMSHADKIIFQLLKRTICAAEYRATYSILRTVNPLEAKLVQDPSMQFKVRFRFGGETFPPFIMFKIFLHTEGHGYKYFSGKNMLKLSSKAAVDAYEIMGRRKYYDQIMEDECFSQISRITDEMGAFTLRDYKQYSSLLDETPASFGGRSNHWRRLDLTNFPRSMLMYDIVNYAESRVMSNRLRKEMKYLIQKPKTEEMRQNQLRIVSEVRYSSALSSSQPLHQRCQQQSQIKHLCCQSKQEQMKVEKMKKADKMAEEIKASVRTEPQTNTPGKKQQQMIVFSSPSFDIVKFKELTSDDKLEKEKERLFFWCQDLYTHHFPSC